MKKIIAFILVSILSSFGLVSANENELKVEYVDVLSPNSIDIYFNFEPDENTLSNVNISKNILWKSSVSNEKTLLFSSENDLDEWKYHFLTIWVESKISLDITKESIWKNFNFSSESDIFIENVSILNDRNIEVSYNTNLPEWVKIILIKENPKLSSLLENNTLNLTFWEKFDVSAENIISLYGVFDIFWNEINSENAVYLFVAWEEIIAHSESEKSEEIIVIDWDLTQTLDEKDDFEITEIANEITVLPETWASHILLVILSLVLTILYFSFWVKRV